MGFAFNACYAYPASSVRIGYGSSEGMCEVTTGYFFRGVESVNLVGGRSCWCTWTLLL